MVSGRPCFWSRGAQSVSVSPMSVQLLINPYFLKRRRKWASPPDYVFTESLGPSPASKSAFNRLVPCRDGSRKPGCSRQRWPAVPVNKAKLQALQLTRGGWEKPLPSHFCQVTSETACKQQDFTPAEAPFCNNIADIPVFERSCWFETLHS